ncbi:HD domain-containing protein [Alginatibacterium sediminis]|uniref:HD domain-containing protein n=1 Tax=Alginatibacterium sediminis TaxID=2164068 RepID=A0A420E9U9_9ALTE|nr:HD domain-containing phosphohydrolase [Alginatibacterium sediminis]RKF17445.1 HD domain-containing protein [Alginatibacterium sediminis]
MLIKALKSFCMGLVMLVCQVIEASAVENHVLVLHSYNAGYEWTQELQNGISDAIQSADRPIHLSVEYIDSKRVNSPEYFARLQDYLSTKYQNYQIDGLLITDDYALRFLNQLNLNNFKNLPTVAAGINDFKASLHTTTSKGTILYERDYIKQNLQLIVKLRPAIKRLYYVADNSLSSNVLRKSFLEEFSHYPNIELIEVRDQDLQETSHLLSSIDEKDAVLLTHFNTEIKNNIYHGYTKTAEVISLASKAPVFVMWGFYLKGDVLGGYVNRSYMLGQQMITILSKQLPNPVRVTLQSENLNPSVFQFGALQKFGISQELLPSDALILNKPVSFFTRNFALILISGSIISVLLLIIVLLGFVLKRKKEIIKKDKKILTLQGQTMRVQKSLIHVLGESIETRSGETGNHVRRVAKLSVLLAKYAGLSHRERDILETISPMHDVGKIGIPEVILSKTTKLSSNEWTLMQNHCRIGYKLLYGNEGDIMRLAAIIALEHHEYWNGCGYPDGKSGEGIHIYSRITAIADVFDALLSKRCYKESWPIQDVVEYFRSGSGQQFDPKLSQYLLENIEQFVAIRHQYPDEHYR